MVVRIAASNHSASATYSNWKATTSAVEALTLPVARCCACSMARSSTAQPAAVNGSGEVSAAGGRGRQQNQGAGRRILRRSACCSLRHQRWKDMMRQCSASCKRLAYEARVQLAKLLQVKGADPRVQLPAHEELVDGVAVPAARLAAAGGKHLAASEGRCVQRHRHRKAEGRRRREERHKVGVRPRQLVRGRAQHCRARQRHDQALQACTAAPSRRHITGFVFTCSGWHQHEGCRPIRKHHNRGPQLTGDHVATLG